MADDPPSSITATTSKDTGGGEAYTSPYAPSAVDLDGIVGRVAALDPTSMDGWIPEMVRGAPTLNGRGLLAAGSRLVPQVWSAEIDTRTQGVRRANIAAIAKPAPEARSWFQVRLEERGEQWLVISVTGPGIAPNPSVYLRIPTPMERQHAADAVAALDRSEPSSYTDDAFGGSDPVEAMAAFAPADVLLAAAFQTMSAEVDDGRRRVHVEAFRADERAGAGIEVTLTLVDGEWLISGADVV